MPLDQVIAMERNNSYLKYSSLKRKGHLYGQGLQQGRETGKPGIYLLLTDRRILKLARTSADLAGSKEIQFVRPAEALRASQPTKVNDVKTSPPALAGVLQPF